MVPPEGLVGAAREFNEVEGLSFEDLAEFCCLVFGKATFLELFAVDLDSKQEATRWRELLSYRLRNLDDNPSSVL